MGALTMYGPGFRCPNTLWKAPGVYIHIHQTSSPYRIGAGRNHHFGAETFFLLMALRHLILAHWVLYHVKSNSDMSKGSSMTQLP
jgi:hypothetical protein